jgi:hypothetical protein
MADYFPSTITSAATLQSMGANDHVSVLPNVTLINTAAGYVIDDSSWGNAEIDGVVEGGTRAQAHLLVTGVASASQFLADFRNAAKPGVQR